MWYILFFLVTPIYSQHINNPSQFIKKPTIKDQVLFCRRFSQERLKDEMLIPVIEPYIFSYVSITCTKEPDNDTYDVYNMINGHALPFERYEQLSNIIVQNAMQRALKAYSTERKPKINKNHVIISAGFSSIITALITSTVALITHFSG